MRFARSLPLFLMVLALPSLMAACSHGEKVQEEKKGRGEGSGTEPFPKGNWRLIAWKGEGDPSKKPESKSILRIEADSSFTLDLKVNECHGSLSSKGPGKLSFEGPRCTEMCCDTEFQQQMVIDLSRIGTFVLEKDRLILKGGGIRSVWKAVEEVQQ